MAFFKGFVFLIIALAGLFVVRYYSASGLGSAYPSGRLTPAQKHFRITSYTLDISVKPAERRLYVRCAMRLRFTDTPPDTLRLNFVDGFTIHTLKVNGRPVEWHYENNYLLWLLPASANTEDITVQTVYHGSPLQAVRAPWRGGFVWRKDKAGFPWIGLACQGEGGKIWLPTRDGAGLKSDSLTLRIRVPRPLYAAASGHLVRTDSLRDTLTYTWQSNYPIAHYNINFAVGRFHVLTDTLHGKGHSVIPVRVYALPGDTLLFRSLLTESKKIVHTLEDFCGAWPWPEDKIAIAETPFFGMENQTLIAYGSQNRVVRAGPFRINRLLIHELAHEWWGNKISAARWRDFWLQEAFASYMEVLYTEAHYGRETMRLYLKRMKRAVRNKIPLIQNDVITSSKAYNADLYNKGALFLHSVRHAMGDDAFFTMLKSWARQDTPESRNRHSFTEYAKPLNHNLRTTEQFFRHVQNHTSAPMEALFQTFLFTTDTSDTFLPEDL